MKSYKMNLKYLIYFSFILVFSCIEPTIVQDIDCNGVIGGGAIVDNCGYCTGGTTELTFNTYLGCDNACQGTQLDCDNTCGGSAMRDCNDTCGGTAYYDYKCEDTNLDSFLNLESRELTCINGYETGNCKPNTDSCLFMDCLVDTLYAGTVINCQGELPLCDEASGTCINYVDYLDDGTCDFLDTNCKEFNFDEGDCNLIDCKGIHFSEELCVKLFDIGCTKGDSTWLGNGFCDEGEDEVLPLNFNCLEWNYDGGDCATSSGRIRNIHKFNSTF